MAGTLSGRPLAYVLPGFLATHVLRYAIIRYGWLQRPFKNTWPGLFAGTILACVLATGIYETEKVLTGSGWQTRYAWVHIIEYAFFIVPWTLIYYMYVQAERTRQDELERQHLAHRAEEMQQQAEKTAVDIDFIISSLSRIQTLVDKDPAACRAEITEFSHLLRVATLSSTIRH